MGTFWSAVSRAAVFFLPSATLHSSCTFLRFFAIFCTAQKHISFYFNALRALAQKHRGWHRQSERRTGGNKHGNLILGRDCRIS
jgi:hypothetical protein